MKDREELKKKAIKEIGGMQIKILSTISSLALILIGCSLITWMWIDWYYQWRLMLSSTIVFIVLYKLQNFIEDTISKAVDQSIEKTNKNPNNKSKFQQRLEEMQKTIK